MKLLVVGPKSIHVSSFIKAINKAGVTPYFLTEEECKYSDVQEEKIVSFRKAGLNNLQGYKEIKNWLKEIQPDCVHIHQANRQAFVVIRICKSLNIRVVLTAWGSDVLTVPDRSRFHKWLTTYMLKNSDAITADSEDMITAMRQLHPKGNYIHLQYGIDVLDAGIKENMVYSNRLHKAFYRIDKIIDYFSEFYKENTDWKLVIAGSGDQTQYLKEQVKKNALTDNVQFVGWLDSKQNQYWYQRSKIYISIPESDGTSVSLLEAMSAGCIPIVPNIDVSKEWITSGTNGIIEGENNPLFEAEKLNWEDCYKINRKKVIKSASRAECTNSFIKLYNK